MKQLSDTIKRNSFTYKKEGENQAGFLYGQYDGENLVGFEVFERRENHYHDCISFPGNNAFGLWAWSFFGKGAKNRAVGRLNLLKKNCTIEKR